MSYRDERDDDDVAGALVEGEGQRERGWEGLTAHAFSQQARKPSDCNQYLGMQQTWMALGSRTRAWKVSNYTPPSFPVSRTILTDAD